MTFALTRDGDWVAAILCSLRPSPAAAGVWSGYGWVLHGDRLFVEIGAVRFLGGFAGLGLRSQGSFGG
jgi:hypothetical protein